MSLADKTQEAAAFQGVRSVTGADTYLTSEGIHTGDAESVLRNVPSGSVRLTVTSPPYFQARQYVPGDCREIGTERDTAIYLGKLEAVFEQVWRVTAENGVVVWNLGDLLRDDSLLLIPERFVLNVVSLRLPELRVHRQVAWVKSNPVPNQGAGRRGLVRAHEPFFVFTKGKAFTFNSDGWEPHRKATRNGKLTASKGAGYLKTIRESDVLTADQKSAAEAEIGRLRQELSDGVIHDFRMKLRGVHATAYGGLSGGRNDQIEKNGFTAIRMKGEPMRRDWIQTSVRRDPSIRHSAVFPLELVENFVRTYSNPGDLVLDPFLGSGTTVVAAAKNRRRWLGIDLNGDFCRDSEARLRRLGHQEEGDDRA